MAETIPRLDVEDEVPQLIGFILANQITKDDNTKYGYVHWIAVHPEWRRKRIGTALYERAVELMDDVELILADTPDENFSAKSFFVYHGFNDPIQHVFMSLKLSESSNLEGIPDHPSLSNITSSSSSSSNVSKSSRSGNGGSGAKERKE